MEEGNTTTTLQQDRSAKAINRTADVNVQEKSDWAEVPMNQPNKEGEPSAEVGEGRDQTGENIVQTRMRPTQSGERMSQGLGGVRQVAKERKQERFTALLHHVSVDLLRDSFYALKRQAAPGTDGVTWQEYETGLEDRLVDLPSRVHRGAYRARPSRVLRAQETSHYIAPTVAWTLANGTRFTVSPGFGLTDTSARFLLRAPCPMSLISLDAQRVICCDVTEVHGEGV